MRRRRIDDRHIVRQSRVILALLVACASAPAVAGPISLTFTNTYTSTVACCVPSAVIGTGALFPAALGQLHDVELTFDGRVTFGGIGGLNRSRLLVPIPYVIYPFLQIRIRGLTDLYDLQPFVVSTALNFSGTGTDISAAIGVYSFRFSYADVLDAFIGPHDVTRSTTFVAPSSLGAQLDDFDSDRALSNALLLTYTLDFAGGGNGHTRTAPLLTATSLLQVTTRYEFSPVIAKPSEPTVAVPAPGTALLLLTGLAMAGAARRMPRSVWR
jgi:hypothetical protein